MNLLQVLPELIMGLVLGGFAWAFKAWASTLGASSERILERLGNISSELHKHRLENESRLMKVETDLKHIFKRFDRFEVQKENKVDKD